jgi:hypothetical protein
MKIDHFLGHFLPDTVRYGKKYICPDYKDGQMKNMYISDFSILKLHHRDFCLTYREIFKK